jgi:hypothetical protein
LHHFLELNPRFQRNLGLLKIEIPQLLETIKKIEPRISRISRMGTDKDSRMPNPAKFSSEIDFFGAKSRTGARWLDHLKHLLEA